MRWKEGEPSILQLEVGKDVVMGVILKIAAPIASAIMHIMAWS